MQQRKTYLLTLFLSLGMMTPAEAVVQTFNDKAAFLTATAASSASGPLPDLGPVGEPTTVGTVTFWLAPGGNTLSIGTRDTVAAPDWYPLMEGNEIALGYENLQVQTAAPVFALGFDFVEPDTTMPSFGGAPVDSPYEVVLYAGSLEVGRTSFNALDDEIGFVGVWNDRAFDRVTIIDTTGNHDDEFFGEFYTGALACSGERCSVAQASQCAANKIESSGTYMDAALDCYAKAASKGQAVARDCLQQAEGKLASSFASAEDAGACKTIGDTATIETTLDTAVANLVAAVGGSGPSQCTEQKLNAVGEDAESQHRCYANAIAKGAGHSVEIECQTKATQRFLADFTRAEAKGDCARGTTGGPAVDAKVGVTVRRIRAVLSRPVTTCAPVEVMAMHGEGFLGNARLAKIAHGKVPCMHSEEGKITTCSFSTVPGSESGEWLESPEGSFAMVGQAISRRGEPGGEYIVAAKVSDAAPAPCLEPTRMDTLGLISEGTELSKTCMLQEVLRDYNALTAEWEYRFLVNYSDLEVCTSSNPHPDRALLVRSFPQPGSVEDDTFCYTGNGAALNDINGEERDPNGIYYGGENYCHMLWSNSYEVPAAKRPATRSFPAPGSVRTNTPILWRPVNPNLNIANGQEAVGD